MRWRDEKIQNFHLYQTQTMTVQGSVFKKLATRRSKIHRKSIYTKIIGIISNLPKVFDLIFVHKHQAILFKDLSLQVVRRTAYTRQSVIYYLFSTEPPFEPAENARSLCRNANEFRLNCIDRP